MNWLEVTVLVLCLVVVVASGVLMLSHFLPRPSAWWERRWARQAQRRRDTHPDAQPAVLPHGSTWWFGP